MKEGDLVKLILKHYKGNDNIKLFRVQSGQARVKGGVMHFAPAGTPDICGYKGGSFIGIECKTTAKESKLSPEQIEFRTHAYRAGAVYIEARHLQDVIDIIGF